VTLISSERKYKSNMSDADSAMVVLHTLQRFHGPRYEYVAIVTPDISEETVHSLQNLHITVEVLHKTNAPHGESKGATKWVDTYSKLWVWGLEEYSKIVYFDADHLILKPMDELFSYPELGAVGFGKSSFLAGMLVLVPDTRKLETMLKAMQHPECYAENEKAQSFLNWYFFNSWHEVPYEFSAYDLKDDTPRFDLVKAVHGKFLQESDCLKCKELFMQQWKEIENITLKLS